MLLYLSVLLSRIVQIVNYYIVQYCYCNGECVLLIPSIFIIDNWIRIFHTHRINYWQTTSLINRKFQSQHKKLYLRTFNYEINSSEKTNGSNGTRYRASLKLLIRSISIIYLLSEKWNWSTDRKKYFWQWIWSWYDLLFMLSKNKVRRNIVETINHA